MTTKTTIVPRAIFDLRLAIQMQEFALLIATLAVLRVEKALGHFAHVVLVQELALVSLLAKTSQPMLAYDRLVAYIPNYINTF